MKLYTLYCKDSGSNYCAARRYTSLTRLKNYIQEERESNSLKCAMYIKNENEHIVKRYASINN
jgi:hypothetical protein